MTERELLEMSVLFQKRALICAQLIAIKKLLYPSLDESSIAQLVGKLIFLYCTEIDNT